MKKDASHVGLGPKNQLQCNHCGISQEMPSPILLGVMVAASKAFGKAHARCKAPSSKRCEICLKLGHTFHDHVRLHVHRAEDWPECGDTCASSMAIFAHMMGWPIVALAPLDPQDFGRCYRMLQAPWAATWRARIGEMARYPAWEDFAVQWGELESLYAEESPSGMCPKLYEAMKRCRGVS